MISNVFPDPMSRIPLKLLFAPNEMSRLSDENLPRNRFSRCVTLPVSHSEPVKCDVHVGGE